MVSKKFKNNFLFIFIPNVFIFGFSAFISSWIAGFYIRHFFSEYHGFIDYYMNYFFGWWCFGRPALYSDVFYVSFFIFHSIWVVLFFIGSCRNRRFWELMGKV